MSADAEKYREPSMPRWTPWTSTNVLGWLPGPDSKSRRKLLKRKWRNATGQSNTPVVPQLS